MVATKRTRFPDGRGGHRPDAGGDARGPAGQRLVDALIVWNTPDRKLEPGPRTPAGRTPGRSAGSTLGLTAGGTRMRPSPPFSPPASGRGGAAAEASPTRSPSSTAASPR